MVGETLKYIAYEYKNVKMGIFCSIAWIMCILTVF